MDFLVASHIHKQYSRHVALNDLSLSVPSQSIFGLLGPNGAGKSSFIRIVAQIIKQDSGEILINNEVLARKHTKLVGYLPEERGLYKKMEVANMLLYFARLKDMSPADAKAQTKIWLEKFNLSEWANSKVDKLSKGMQQKLQFITTVIHKPSLIILDEPFSGFDPVNVELVAAEIKQLRDEGCTIIMSTHRMESVETLCDRVAMIHQSNKVLDGTVHDVKSAFKKSRYEIEYKGNSISESALFTIVSNHHFDEGYSRAVVLPRKGLTANELIQDVSRNVEIQLFKELVPSMKEIFLEKVNA